MSAYMCSERQLTILAVVALRYVGTAVPSEHRTELDSDGFERSPGGYERTVTRVFRMLVAENLASLRFRYPNDAPGSVDDYKPVKAEILMLPGGPRVPWLHIIKACHHYSYQSCEHPGWEESDARKLMRAIEAHAVHSLPGYNEAPWGLG